MDSLSSEPPGKTKFTGVGSVSLLQGISLTQELNQGLLHCITDIEHCICLDFPGGSEGKGSACDAGDLGLIPGLGRSPGGDTTPVDTTPVFLPEESPWAEEPGGLQSMGLQTWTRLSD